MQHMKGPHDISTIMLCLCDYTYSVSDTHLAIITFWYVLLLHKFCSVNNFNDTKFRY